jgi:hypothetical protein
MPGLAVDDGSPDIKVLDPEDPLPTPAQLARSESLMEKAGEYGLDDLGVDDMPKQPVLQRSETELLSNMEEGVKDVDDEQEMAGDEEEGGIKAMDAGSRRRTKSRSKMTRKKSRSRSKSRSKSKRTKRTNKRSKKRDRRRK